MKEPQIAIISWVNDRDKWNNVTLRYLHTLWDFQRVGEGIEVEYCAIEPEDACKTIGQAYELGRNRTTARIKIYIHQDATVTDPTFYQKLLVFAEEVPEIGMLGFVGSKIDTGASWMHADIADCVGFVASGEQHFDSPSVEPIALMDGYACVVLPSAAHIPWAVDYYGPHMAVEDMCMRVREAGLEVWSIDSRSYHESDGTVDDGYWRSVELFYSRWGPALGPHARPPSHWREEYEAYIANFS